MVSTSVILWGEGTVARDRRHVPQLALGLAVGGGATIGTAALCAHRSRVPVFVTGTPEAARPLTPPSAVADLFRPGTRHVLDTGEHAVASTQTAGVLHMPTGQLVA